MALFASREAVAAAAEELQAPELARWIVERSLPTIPLVEAKHETASWMSDEARIPIGLEWPAWDGVPMSHLARIELQGMPNVFPFQPRHGRLSFFVSQNGPQVQNGAVLYDDGSQPLADLTRPDGARWYPKMNPLQRKTRVFLETVSGVWSTPDAEMAKTLVEERHLPPELIDHWDLIRDDNDSLLRARGLTEVGSLFGWPTTYQGNPTPEPRFSLNANDNTCWMNLACFRDDFFAYIFDIKLSDLTDLRFSNVVVSIQA